MRHAPSLSFLALALLTLATLAPAHARACGPYDPLEHAREQGARTAALSFLASQHTDVAYSQAVLLETDGTARVLVRGAEGLHTLTLAPAGDGWRVVGWNVERPIPPAAVTAVSGADAPR